MKIGVLTHNYPRFSGDFSGPFVEQLCQELVHQGEDVHVIAPYDAAYTPETLAQPQPRLHLYRYAWSDEAHQLGYMRTMQADIRMKANAYLLSPPMFLAGIRATMRVARAQKLDVLHAHWVLPNGFIAAVASKRLDVPLAVSIPGSDALVAAQNPMFRQMARFAFSQASLITANSRELRQVAVDDLGADPERFDLIIYGVAPDKLQPDEDAGRALRQRLGIPADAFVTLAVGRMVYKKGFDVLLRALALLPEEGRPVHAVFIGDGDLWELWQELGQNLGLRNVHWAGRVPNDEMAAWYNMADVLVMPSVTRPVDGLNVCVLDAMACGKPVIGSDCAGNDLVIEEGVNGFIVPEGDAEALARALTRLRTDPARARRMGEASRRMIDQAYGWPHLARRYREHFQRMMEARARA
jgi:glycosyltransferase involved in cell wall biosynthesis